MPRDPRVDAYIAKSAEFARPVLEHIREVMHSVDGAMSETMKWGMPFFEWNGRPVGNMAAFKAHAAFGFWRREADGLEASDAMGQFGKLTRVSDLPPNDRITDMVREAIALIEAGAKTARPLKQAKIPLAMPEDFATALAAASARANFDTFPPGAQREYLEWILEAKQAETRSRRLQTASEWIAEGKRRNWKHQNG